ncbi:MAG: PIN domain protein [Bacteroidetes bacterium]|nr:PIN domain protein [Bacteroidota bacterium]
MKIYIDTSVIGGCFDEEFAEWSNKLFDEFRKGKKVAVVSDQTLQELEKAPNQVKKLIQSVPVDYFFMIELDDEARLLAKRYIQEGVINRKHLVDAQHIAMATIYHVDFLASVAIPKFTYFFLHKSTQMALPLFCYRF